MAVTLRRFTVDQLDALPEDGNRYELLDGVLFVTSAPGLPHQIVATRLAAILHAFLERLPGVFVAAPGVVELRPGVRMSAPSSAGFRASEPVPSVVP